MQASESGVEPIPLVILRPVFAKVFRLFQMSLQTKKKGVDSWTAVQAHFIPGKTTLIMWLNTTNFLRVGPSLFTGCSSSSLGNVNR